MSHLIQTFENEGVKYCYKHGNTTPPWRSESIIGSGALAGLEDDDIWVSGGDGVNGGLSVRFGTCCLWKAAVVFVLQPDVAIYEGSIFLNGDYVGGPPSGTVGSYYFEIDLNALGLMGRPCGNRWDITASYEDGSGNAAVAVQIQDQTYGPPV